MSKTVTSDQEGIASASIKDAEHFRFSVPSEGIAVVENTRHDEHGEHTYAVNVAQTGETSACSCPADEYQQKCKHRKAVESEPCVVLAATSEPRQ
jgi:hypothetical protein